MNTKSDYIENQPIKYWLMEITLTSGEILEFYVKAINQKEADKKGLEYAELAENEALKNYYKKFRLLP
jgi:hypothetical protein